MGNPEEIPNIEPFPLSPRDQHEVEKSAAEKADPAPEPRKTSFTPAHRIKTEFWHHGEQPSGKAKVSDGTQTKGRDVYSKKADHYSMILALVGLVFVGLLALVLVIFNQKYLYKQDKENGPEKTVSTDIDFYGEVNSLEKKLQVQKAFKAAHPGEGDDESLITQDLNIPIEQQISGMEEKLRKMRRLKAERLSVDSASTQSPRKIELTPSVVPLKEQDFTPSAEFNSLLPKSLR
jgi:hypothetical protein